MRRLTHHMETLGAELHRNGDVPVEVFVRNDILVVTLEQVVFQSLDVCEIVGRDAPAEEQT